MEAGFFLQLPVPRQTAFDSVLLQALYEETKPQEDNNRYLLFQIPEE